MLSEVDLLDNIGRFQRLQHRAEAFKNLALLFARNGCGKTTICAVLRSAMSQDSHPIDERAHLGASGTPSATLHFDGQGTVAFNNGSWNSSPPPMLIFDADYVRSNVHAAEEVTRDNKRRLLQVIIGSAGVTLADRIKALDEENDRVNATVRKAEAAIRQTVPVVTDIAAFVAAAVPDDLAARTAAAARQVTVSERTADIGRRPLLRHLTLGDAATDYPELLKEAVGELGSDGAGLIAEHIAKHRLEPEGRRWLRYGVQHATADDCPFCDQSLQGSPVIEPMRVLFSEDYQRLSDTVDGAWKAVEELAGDGPGSLGVLLAQNEAQAAFWATVAELPQVPSMGDAELARAKEELGQMAAALRAKGANPSAPVLLTNAQCEQWRWAVGLLRGYSAAVAEANNAIEAVKAAGDQSPQGDVATAKHTLAKYQALAVREAEPLKSLCADWAQATARHKAIANERTEAQKALRTHTETMAAEYQESVNELLEQFGANFRLCQTKASFKGGGQPNTEYCIDINGHMLPVGEAKERAPSFKTVLSSGDKASLALALFIAQAKRRTDLADLILVFDDPFNSQDAARQFETSARLRELARLARQVVVLSHDARFLHLIQKDANPTLCSEHHIVMTGDWRGTISPWSAQKEVETEYVRRAQRIRAYAGTGQHLNDCSPQQLAGDLRVFMEEYLDQRFPGRFAAKVALGGMVDEIEAAGSNDPLFPQRMALREINEFSRPDHHRGSQQPEPTQLRAQCQKVVKIIGSY